MTSFDRNDCAVAFCCDRNYFHLALFMIRQIAFHNPHRAFDFVIASKDDLTVPDWARDFGIVLHKPGAMPELLERARYLGSVAPLYRIMLASGLGDRYRRILYLDCDMFVEGGDFNRLLEVDIGPHPIAAVLDAPCMYEVNYRAREFVQLGWPAMPYANTGLQVIDTKAYREQDVERRSFEVCASYPQALIYGDQSLTNVALKGKFAQLAPCWNWQCNARLPLVPLRYPIFLRHFIGFKKPDRSTEANIEIRFNQAYRDFLQQHMPEQLAQLAPIRDTSPLTLKESMTIVFRHLMAQGIVADHLKRHHDPYKAIY